MMRRILGMTGAGLMAALVIFLGGCGQPVDQPNLMLVVLCTTRADALSCYGGQDAQTERMDQLAKRGILFEEAIAHNPYTLGSVATILSSLEPDLHGIKGNTGYRLAPEAETIAEVFRANGYETAAFVSAYPVGSGTGLDQGFDVYDDDFSMIYPIYDAQYLPLQKERIGSERRGDETVQRSVTWLREDRSADRPFFLLVHLFDSHQPYDPPPPIQERFLKKPYAGEVVFTDSLVGLLLDELEEQGLDKTTVVSIVGDHGEAFREHNEATHGFLLYETTLRVPWILTGPGIPSARAQGPVGLVNVAPTLLASCGLPLPPSHQGANLLDEVKGSGRTAQLPESGIYLETYLSRLTHKWSELIGWRKGEWKYVRGPRSELFNLDSDPEELVNLLESEGAKAEELSGELDGYLRRENAHRMEDVVTSPDAETRERLESLGYAGGGSDADVAKPGWEVGLPDPRDAIIFWNRRQEAMAFYRIAISNFHGGNFEESLKWADNAILADSTHTDAFLLRCKSLAALERYEEAVQHYGALLQRRPNDESAWIGLGIALDLLGQWEKAKTAFESALLINVDSPEANFNLASLLARRQRFIDAAPYYERVRELEPENVPVRADLARVYLRLNQPDHALEILEEAHGLDPAHPGTMLLLGSLHLEKGDSSRGREMLEKFLNLYPDRPEVAEVRKALEDL